MKFRGNNWAFISAIAVFLAMTGYQCSSSRKSAGDEPVEILNTNVDGKGIKISVGMTKGESHNHPLMAIWIEDTEGNYIETLYVSESIGKGVFQHGDKSKGQWESGPIRRPAALPYWGHKRGVQAPDGLYLPTPEEPMPDAVTGPTPQGSFLLNSKATGSTPTEIVILLEINQSWDWNGYWTNSRFPGDDQYKTSSQPSLVYAATIDLDSETRQYDMKPIGHGHYAGRDGSLTSNLSTLTTALNIIESAQVTIW